MNKLIKEIDVFEFESIEDFLRTSVILQMDY